MQRGDGDASTATGKRTQRGRHKPKRAQLCEKGAVSRRACEVFHERAHQVESSLTFANGEKHSLLDDVARGVVGEFDAVNANKTSARCSRRTWRWRNDGDSLRHAGHARKERAIAAVLANDGEGRGKGGEASDRESRTARKARGSARRNGGDGGGGSTHDPVVKAKNSRRSSRENSDMIERRSRTGRLSIVKPWSALTALVRPALRKRS